MVLTVAVIALSVALSVRKEKPVMLTPGSCYATCPNGWIGFGSKCFYFSEDRRNWTFSQTYYMEQAAQLARFENLEEMNFLKRYVGYPCYWIGLYRESLQHPWKWTDDSEYNDMYVFIPLFFKMLACVALHELWI
ncbi:C-type lectin domain family 2 member E [Lemmus lemmus]